ncbi:MAG: hypothetical protein WBK95_07830 [Sulfurimonas sp.]|nr:hypothetical protein [Sulfurimonas sp.]MDD3060763.1 hypothetical protein [Sulfurimonas sp.]MDD5202209.1 hypothetical protein [Sulfurimonas sp.]
MKKIPKIKLTQAPLIMAFLKNIIPLRDDMPFDIEMLKHLTLIGMCGCGQKDCATITCRYIKEWNEDLKGSWGVNTNQGIIILHFLNKGIFELEAIDYEQFPYRSEVQRLLHKNYIKPTPKEYEKLDRYFKYLKEENMNVVNLGEIE